ncbi:MAG: ATP-binding protein, partial [Methanobacterium sp.]|uniref:sensor histidine kinase n=1 Tax=Methanobacterium sp. TaxID=2164 RepID=UPI003C795B85
MRALPIRVRLTLWYSLAVAVTMFSIGCAALWMVHRAIDALESEELQQRVRGVRRFIESRPPGETRAQLNDAITAAYNVSHGNKWLQVIDQNGNWIYRSPHAAAAYPALALPQQAPRNGRYFTYIAESISVRALIEVIEVHGVRYTVQTGLTLTKTMDVLSNFRIQLFVLITIGLIASSLAGYFMSRKALNPIAAIAAEARLINDRNLDIRMSIPSAKDEISELSLTLNQMLERIDKAFASVRTFTGNASHELRTPISLLRTEIEVALLRPRDAVEYRAVLGRLHGETVLMTNLIENLLSLARADGGVKAVALLPIRMGDLFRLTTQRWKNAMDRAMLDFSVDCPQPELIVLADEQGILRLLSILLDNASKYTPPGGFVTLAASADEGRVLLSVRDSGIGIAVEDFGRIFDRYYRAVPLGERTASGSGLGLALGKWIAECHGTRLCVESEPGHGSCFSIWLQRTYAMLPSDQRIGNLRSDSRPE